MQEVINLNLVSSEKDSSIDPKAVIDSLMSSALKDRLEFEPERMLIRVDIFDSKASQTVWEAVGRRFPLAMYFDAVSEGGKDVIKLFETLSSVDRADIDLIPSKIGSRMSLYVKRERHDLVARFWAAMYPSGIVDDTARARKGRVRDEDCISIKVPDNMVRNALKTGKAVETSIKLDGSVFVTEELFRQLRKNHERDLLKKHGKAKGKTRS